MDLAKQTPEQWASRPGLVLTMAGGAVGRGNFYGKSGAAFMIPCFFAVLILGIPLMCTVWRDGNRCSAT